jgi:hypothetical protein
VAPTEPGLSLGLARQFQQDDKFWWALHSLGLTIKSDGDQIRAASLSDPVLNPLKAMAATRKVAPTKRLKK